MKKRTKIIFAVIIIILIIFAILIISYINHINKEKKSVNDFINVKEIAEYYGCKYISSKKSEEEGFSKDIRIIFPLNPITENGNSNKYNYEMILGGISPKMNRKDFRIIDESKNLIVRVYFKGELQTYTINNDDRFFDHLVSNYSIDNKIEDSVVQLNINSSLLNQLVENKWRTTKINLGTIDSTVDKYDIYFDEGYKIRKINGQVYNIVFTNKYKEQIVNGLKADNTVEEVEQTIGQATYSFKLENGTILKGYKTEQYYIFFNENEISVYPNKTIDKQDEFAEIFTQYLEDMDINNFLSKLTDIWPDYSKYSKDSNLIQIDYPLRGVSIIITNRDFLSIKIYNNYDGKITKDISVQDIKNNKILPLYVNMELRENFVNVEEQNRIMQDVKNRNPIDNVETLMTEKYAVYLNEEQCTFYSTDKEYIDSTITISANNIYKLNDTTFVYSINGKGIYAYIAPDKETKEIITGSGDFSIRKIEDNIIYYNDTKIEANI